MKKERLMELAGIKQLDEFMDLGGKAKSQDRKVIDTAVKLLQIADRQMDENNLKDARVGIKRAIKLLNARVVAKN